MSAILQIHSQDSSATPQPAQISVRRIDYLDLCRQYGIILTSMVALDHPGPVPSNQRRGTNPIGRQRVSGLAQSGFNEVAHGTRTPALRRATSQNPPDSLVGVLVIHREPAFEGAGDGYGLGRGSRALA